MFRHPSTTRIPPMKGKFSLPRSPPEQVVKARKPVPSSHILLPRPKKSEVKVQEEPRKGAATEEEAHMKTRGQDDWHREPHSTGDMPLISRPLETNGVATFPKCSPEPLDLLPRHPEGNLSENTQTSPRNSSPESHVTGSDSPVGDVLPPSKPDPDAAVFSAPTTCCSLLPKRPTKGLGEDHRPNSPGSPTSGKEMQREKPSDMPSRSASSAVSASSRRCKRKIPLPLPLPLPLPPPPLQLQWGRASGAIYAPTGSTSANVMPAFDINAMDTTPPSQAVIFHSPPISRDNHYPFHMIVPGSDNTPPSGSNAVAYASPGLPANIAGAHLANTQVVQLEGTTSHLHP
ncbi:putative UPF0607 protein [Camelus dromedarius]|uniref:Putative UPF0607 protein n=1 Tax=Camelus dromedarius TaxID=9838 RepID=A0A5N4E942_CAMDR|nr:putative UPF0607 protein [Camelus dromedarius]